VSGDETSVKESALFFHCGILCLKLIWTLKWKEVCFKISLSISLRESVGIGFFFFFFCGMFHISRNGQQL